MSTNKTRTYTIDQAGFDALRTRLVQEGATVPDGNSGQISSPQGVTLGCSYADGVLTLNIDKKPMLVPTSLIWHEVDTWIGQQGT